MRKQHNAWSLLSVVIAVTVIGGGSVGSGPSSVSAQDEGVTTITGTLSLDMATDPLQYMGLIDLTGFVRRDYSYAQGNSLIAGWIDHTTGDYRIELPTAPSGPPNDVGHGQGAGPGVQIYSADLLRNITGDERLSPNEFHGWSWTNTSLVTAHGTHEVTGGRILVWAPDNGQRFPTDFGADGRLFTGDDPVGALPAGWTVIDLDERPFAQNRTPLVTIQIGQDEATPDDLSQLPPTQAFDRLIGILRARYPFAETIPVDWDGLRAKFAPEFQAAEESGEQTDFWLALNHFLIALNHWAYFANYPWNEYFIPLFLGSTGLHVDVADDGAIIVAAVDSGQAAERAGIHAGAKLISWNGQPARDAVSAATQPYEESSPQAALVLKKSYFGRAPVGTTIHVEYRNPDSTAVVAADLTAVEIPNEDIERSADCYRTWDRCDASFLPPVRIERLPSNFAVIHLGFPRGDSQITRLVIDDWERALLNIGFSDVKGLIIDLRGSGSLDSGVLPVTLAANFFDSPFPVADVTSVDANGHDVTVGTYSITPAPVQWNRPVAVLVDEFCVGTCELLVLALMHRPGVIVVGMSATGGSLSNAMEPVLLPTGNFVMVVDQAFRDPATHEILVEGKGIEPTLRVPKTAETIVANVTNDVVRDAAVQTLLAQIAASEPGPTATPST
jgi:C-terminal processing protease CtpA/Prc